MSDAAAAVTVDGFLGGRLRLKQPVRGHRAGHDAILLAAATPACPGECVVDLGAGIGTAGLALALRVPGCTVVLVERDEALVQLAGDNIAANKLAARAIAIDVTASAAAFAAAGLGPAMADRVLMNPPFNHATRDQPSPEPARRAAHEAEHSGLEDWVKAARRILKPAGTVSLIWRADGLGDVLAVLARGFGGVTVLPLHPRHDAAALRVLVRATLGSAAPVSLLPGLVLHDPSGQTPPDIQAVLAGTDILPLAKP